MYCFKHFCIKALGFLAILALGSPSLFATYGYGGYGGGSSTKYWDRGGSGYYGSGFGDPLDGVWNNSNYNWNYSSYGYSYYQTDWDNYDRAVFSGIDSSGDFNVEVDGYIAARSITFTGSDANIIDNSGSYGDIYLYDYGYRPDIYVGSGITATFDVNLRGYYGLDKKGSGTLVLTHDNYLSGNVVVQDGTLELSNSSGPALENASKVQVKSGATLVFSEDDQLHSSVNIKLSGGHVETNGTDQELGTLTLTANSTIDLGSSGAGDIVFEPSDWVSWSSGANLNITNWTGDDTGGTGSRIFFGDDDTGLTPGQISQITINGLATQLLSTGELVIIDPVPEASTIAMGVLSIALLAWHGFRRRKPLAIEKQPNSE